MHPSVSVYWPTYNEEHREVLEAFYVGLQAHGVPAQFHLATNYDVNDKPDLAVVFGVGKKAVDKSADRAHIINEQRVRNKRWIVLETGYVHRDRYYAAGYEGLNGRANFYNAGMPGDRWAELGVELKPWRDDGEFVLLCGQVPWDASVQDHNHVKWLEHMAEMITWLGLPAYFSPHPLGPHYTVDGLTLREGENLAEKLLGARSCVTFSSNSAVEAVIDGVPSVAFDIGSMAWDVTGHTLAEIAAPPRPERTQWAYNLAYTQWTLAEMQEGKCWQHLKSGLEASTNLPLTDLSL